MIMITNKYNNNIWIPKYNMIFLLYKKRLKNTLEKLGEKHD